MILTYWEIKKKPGLVLEITKLILRFIIVVISFRLYANVKSMLQKY
ncbi:hypothetical protein GCM10007887_43470 [Methylobacterium haplocladii]|nr:hypothetical protein GCM10007887_43470 [Methylobacterium haplocladii]